MENKFYLIMCLFFILLSSCTKEIEHESNTLYPSDWLFAQRAYPNGKIDLRAYQTSLFESKRTFQNRGGNPGYENPWIFEGPTNVSGRITDVEMFEDNQSTIFACSASGGIFRSDDFGQNWYPIFDEALSLSIGDLDINKNNQNVFYAGTGESNAGGGSLAYDGLGVYKTEDGGETWMHKGLEHAGSIGRIVSDPNNENTVFVACMGSLFSKNDERGVYRSQDGGNSWEQVLFLSDSTGAIDLAIDPVNSNIIYAAMWERIRTVKTRSYGGPTSGIYKSEDGGNTWEALELGLPSLPEEKGRIGLAISANDPNTLYAFYAKQNGSLQGVYYTNNQGENWSAMSTEGISDVPYIWWFGKIFIDPNDSKKVYVASFHMHKSNDGGENWGPIFQGVHVDQHAIYIHPQNSNLVVNGNDGGVYLSMDGGLNWIKSGGLPITQFYTVTVDQKDPGKIFGGTQDNGTNRKFSDELFDWDHVYGGDGFKVQIDPVNSNIVYAEYQYGNLAKSINGGDNFSSAVNGIDPADRNNWNTPYVIDPSDANTLYYGTQRLYKSDDQAESWFPVSDDLTEGPYPGILGYGTITCIDVSGLDSKILYAGTDDGNIWVSKDAGNSFESVKAGIPNRWITSIQASDINLDAVYATVSGFRFGESKGHVFYSSNNGAAWMDITGNLPDIPVNKIIVDPTFEGHLYIGTDIGVFYSLDNGIQWDLLGEHLPNVPIVDLDFHVSTRQLYAASFGRSIYKYVLPKQIATTAVEELFAIRLSPNPTNEILHLSSEQKFTPATEMVIYDLAGNTILKGSISMNEAKTSIDISTLEPGLYLLSLYQYSKRLTTMSFMKM